MQKFEKEYKIRSYECDQKDDLRLVTLMNILQDMADTHAEMLGLGMEFCLKNGYAWFGANYHIKINRLPRVHEIIKVRTWPSEKKKIGAVRDFEIFDQDNHLLVAASSLWILIDFIKKRPLAIDKAVSGYEPLTERALITDFTKLPPLERTDKICCFDVRYDDIDFNRHVNNAVYLLWAAECSGFEFCLHHMPAEIEIAYKKEGKPDDTINVALQVDENLSRYDIRAQDDRELAQLRIKWNNLILNKNKS